MRHLPPTMRRSPAVLAVAVLVALGSAAVPASAGDRSVDPATLTPAPPDFFNAVCDRVGARIQCDLAFVDPAGPVEEESGISCGSGGNAFQVLDTWTRSVTGKRVYSGDGLLLRRNFDDWWQGTLTNSVTGATTSYVQRNTYLHDLAVPGDVGTGNERQTTHLRLVTAHGSTVLESGHVVIAHESDSVLFASGKHAIADYFDNGDTAAVQPICDALS